MAPMPDAEGPISRVDGRSVALEAPGTTQQTHGASKGRVQCASGYQVKATPISGPLKLMSETLELDLKS
jgi:hypothetical protein